MLATSLQTVVYVLTLVGVVALFLSTLLQRSATSGQLPASETSPTQGAENTQEFHFVEGSLVWASPTAQAALDAAALDDNSFDALVSALVRVFPTISSDFAQACDAQGHCKLVELTEQGPVTAQIDATGLKVIVAIRGLTAPFGTHVLVDARQRREDARELAMLRTIAEVSPNPVWRESALGEIEWVNKAYTRLAIATGLQPSCDPDAIPRLFHIGPINKKGDTERRRRTALKTADDDMRMFETVSFALSDGSIHFALDATATALAEDNLRNFMQTLTQTFAELPIGLAIFDRSRQLVMFNPALLELTQLAPEWLSARPTLYDFLNQLREKRMVPERKDFNGWRKHLVELEKSAREGSYQETWTLPTGQVYRVSGRPHPHGAIAFYLEDITTEISLTRKIRGAKQLQDDILDVLPGAFIAFDAQGRVRASNAQFTELWGRDVCAGETVPDIHDMIGFWQEHAHPSPFWGDLRDFVFQQTDRVEWTGTIVDADGKALRSMVMPLAGQVTLVSFAKSQEVELPTPVIAKDFPELRTG